jgi:molybdopterin biosynthesis enzyme
LADGRIEFQKSVKTGNDIRKLGESLRNGQTVLPPGPK